MLGKTLHSVPLCSLHFLSKPDMVWEGRRWKNRSCFNSQANLPLTHQTQLNVKWYQLCIFPVEILFGKPLKIRSLDKSTNPSRIICLSVAAGVSRGALQVGATFWDGRVAYHEGLKPGRQTHHPHLDSSWNKAFPRAIHILIEVGGSQPGFQARFSPPPSSICQFKKIKLIMENRKMIFVLCGQIGKRDKDPHLPKFTFRVPWSKIED